MKLTQKYRLKPKEKELRLIEELSFHTTKLYNVVNYDLRKEKGYKRYEETESLYKDNWHCDFLHSHTRQWCLKVLDQNWSSYFASIKDYKENPHKYTGQPRPPKFKNSNDKKNEVIFTKAGIRFQENVIKLSLSKTVQKEFEVESLNFSIKDVKVPQNILDNLQQIRLAWSNSKKEWELLVIYNQEEEKLDLEFSNEMAIDLGLDNLATVVFKDNKESYIIDGKKPKSVNAYFNKEIARLTSIAMKQSKSSKHFKRTKKIINLQKRRNDFINDYIHKASRKIVDLAIYHKCKLIIIGDFSGVKNGNKAKSFVQIPQERLVQKIKYKAKLLGIKIKMQNEAYTSGCSALDLEKIDKTSYNKNRRIRRGLFLSGCGILVNADVNGALNILRKSNKKCIPRLVEQARDNGFVENPLRLRVAY